MKKTIIITLITLVVLISAGVGIFNSDWYFNKRVQKSNQINFAIPDSTVTYDYYPSYSDGVLKARFEFHNVNEDFVDFAILLIKDEYIYEKHLLDNDKFLVAKLVVNAGDLSKSGTGTFVAQTKVQITKKEMRKIKFAQDLYREGFIR